MVIWVIGLSGSGKSYIGQLLFQKIKLTHFNSVYVDGDEFRKLMLNDLGYSPSERETNGWRITNLCHWLSKQNMNVIASFLSNYPTQQNYNRQTLEQNYYEIYIKSSMGLLKEKSHQNVYKKQKNIVGIDIPFNEPLHSNKIFENNYCHETAKRFVQDVYQDISSKLM